MAFNQCWSTQANSTSNCYPSQLNQWLWDERSRHTICIVFNIECELEDACVLPMGRLPLPNTEHCHQRPGSDYNQRWKTKTARHNVVLSTIKKTVALIWTLDPSIHSLTISVWTKADWALGKMKIIFWTILIYVIIYHRYTLIVRNIG